jgi:hypothetical protein
MGRAKILNTENKQIEMVITSCSIKYVIPTTIENDIGEFIKIEKREGHSIIHFTRKPNSPGVIAKEGITVCFD